MDQADLDKAQAKVNALAEKADRFFAQPDSAVDNDQVFDLICELARVMPPVWHDEDPQHMRLWLNPRRREDLPPLTDDEITEIEVHFQGVFALVNQRLPENWAEFEIFLNVMQFVS